MIKMRLTINDLIGVTDDSAVKKKKMISDEVGGDHIDVKK